MPVDALVSAIWPQALPRRFEQSVRRAAERAQGLPGRFARLIAHLRQFYPARHEVVAIHCSPHPIVPATILRFALEDMGEHAAEIHAGFTLYVPPVGTRAVLDRELVGKLYSVEHLRSVTRA